VYIILYWEAGILYNNSYHAKNRLESLSSNIKVLRHPGGYFPSFWSHHEKMIVIDGVIGFLGGIDLCFGRMDNNMHHLFDSDSSEHCFWNGIDYCNPRIKDFTDVREFSNSNIDKCS